MVLMMKCRNYFSVVGRYSTVTPPWYTVILKSTLRGPAPDTLTSYVRPSGRRHRTTDDAARGPGRDVTCGESSRLVWQIDVVSVGS